MMTYVNHLTPLQRKEVDELFDICRAYEPITIHPCTDQDGFFCLQYQAQQLVSFLGCIFVDKEAEVYPMTHPHFRRQGLFSSALFQLDKKWRDFFFLFPSDGNSQETLACFKALKMQKETTEYLLSYSLSSSKKINAVSCSGKANAHFPSASQNRKVNISCGKTNTYFAEWKPESDSRLLSEMHSQIFDLPIAVSYSYVQSMMQEGASSYLICDKKSHPAGIFFLLFSSPHRCYLCGFGILPRYRKKGLGSAALTVLTQTFLSSADQLFVQVSDQNSDALSLYQNFGFLTEEALTYYIW